MEASSFSESMVFVNANGEVGSQPHSIMVENQVLTSSEANVYQKVMSIVERNRLLEKNLQENAHQFKQRLEDMTKFKNETDKIETTLRDQLDTEKKRCESITKKYEEACKTPKNQEVIKKMKMHLKHLQEIVQTMDRNTIEESEGSMITEAVQDVNNAFDGDFVIVDGPKRMEVTLAKMKSLNSNQAEEVKRSITEIIAIQEEASQSQNLDSDLNQKQKYIDQIIDLKTMNDQLLSENRQLGQVQEENVKLRNENSDLIKKNNWLNQEVQQKSEKIKSLENVSMEFAMPTTDENRVKVEKLQEELTVCKTNLENTLKRNHQLKQDLEEDSVTMEKTDQEILELRTSIDKLNAELSNKDSVMKAAHEQFTKEIEELKKRDDVGFEEDKTIEEMKAKIDSLEKEVVYWKEKCDKDKKLHRGIDNRNINKLEKYLSENKRLQQKIDELNARPANQSLISGTEWEKINECKDDEVMQENSSIVSRSKVSESNTSSVENEPEILVSLDDEKLASAEIEQIESFQNIIAELQKEVSELKEDITSLETEKVELLDQLARTKEELVCTKQELVCTKQELTDTESKLAHTEEELTINSERFQQVQNSLEEEINKRDLRITHKDAEYNTTAQRMDGLEHNYNKLRTSYEAVHRTLEESRRDNKEMYTQLNEKSRLHSEKAAEVCAAESVIEKLRNDLGKYQMALNATESKKQNMEGELTHMRGEMETLEILRVQVQVYENDFNAERSAREKQSGELQKLKEEHELIRAERDGLLQEFDRAFNSDGVRKHHNRQQPPQQGQNFTSAFQMQQQQQQQQQQQHYMQPRQGQGRGQGGGWQQNRGGGAGHQNNDYQSMYGGGAGARPQNEAQQEAVHRPCPKCNEKFPDLDSLQIHMIDCMDDD